MSAPSSPVILSEAGGSPIPPRGVNHVQLAVAGRALNTLAGHLRDLQLDLIRLRRVQRDIPADQLSGLRNALNQISDQCRDAAAAL